MLLRALLDGVLKLEPLYRGDGCHSVAQTLVEIAGAGVCRVIFQERELRALLASPVFSRLEQLSADALIPMFASHRNLRNEAIRHLSVHRVRRLVESGIDEPNDFAAELCDKGYILSKGFRRMLPPMPVARLYRFG